MWPASTRQARPDDALRAFADKLHAQLDHEHPTTEEQTELHERKRHRLDDDVAQAQHRMMLAQPHG
jgi:hypothetical protein